MNKEIVLRPSYNEHVRFNGSMMSQDNSVDLDFVDDADAQDMAALLFKASTTFLKPQRKRITMNKSRGNPQNIKAGDIVTINFINHFNESPFDARVTKITKRYKSDGINYVRLDDSKSSTDIIDRDGTSFCDISFATLKTVAPYVMAMQRVKVKHNNYLSDTALGDTAGHIIPGHPHIYRTDWFPGLIRHIVMGMNVDIPYGFNEDMCIYLLWLKHHSPGYVRTEARLDTNWDTPWWKINTPYVIYNRKHLKRWVRNNISRLIRSQSVAMKAEHDQIMRIEESDLRDMEIDYNEKYNMRPSFQVEQQDAEPLEDPDDFAGLPLTLGDILEKAIKHRRETAEREAACKLLDISPDTTGLSEKGFEL